MNPEDPYAGLLLEMDKRARGQQAPGLLLGTVLEAGEGRLVIRAGGMTLDREDLMADPRLLGRSNSPRRLTMELDQASVTLDVGGAMVQTLIPAGTPPISSIPLYELPGSLTGSVTGAVALDSERLVPGDQVLLLPDSEGQTYYVLCKVVRP